MAEKRFRFHYKEVSVGIVEVYAETEEKAREIAEYEGMRFEDNHDMELYELESVVEDDEDDEWDDEENEEDNEWIDEDEEFETMVDDSLNELKEKVEKIHNAYKAKKRGVRKLVKEFFAEELKNHYWRNMLHTNIKFERESDFGVNEYTITSMYLDSDFSEPTFLVDCEFEKSIESFTTEESVYIMLDYVQEKYGMNL